MDSSKQGQKASIQVYGVYMRLNGTTQDNRCSKLSIYDKYTAYVFGCDNDKKVEEDEEQEQSLLNTTTPVTVRLSLTEESLPRYVWIGFEGKTFKNFSCHRVKTEPAFFIFASFKHSFPCMTASFFRHLQNKSSMI